MTEPTASETGATPPRPARIRGHDDPRGSQRSAGSGPRAARAALACRASRTTIATAARPSNGSA